MKLEVNTADNLTKLSNLKAGDVFRHTTFPNDEIFLFVDVHPDARWHRQYPRYNYMGLTPSFMMYCSGGDMEVIFVGKMGITP